MSGGLDTARPWWANALLAFCAFMTFVYTPWDIFWKPIEVDQEVWFGVVLHGWAAKVTAPVHWLIYGVFTYGLWKMRPWVRLWGTLYMAQVAIAMVVWGLTDERGSLGAAIGSGLVFTTLTLLFWRAGMVFEGERTRGQTE
jgi:hypothetical protein